MELVSLGIDTLRPKFVAARETLPVNEKNFRTAMVNAGWTPRVSSHLTGDRDEPLVHSTTYSYQLEGDTLRFFIINAGRDLIAEYSAPRFANDSIFNFQLASPKDAWKSIEKVSEILSHTLPINNFEFDLERFQRIDVAADVFTEEYKVGIISAGARFKIPGARRQDVVIYPSETAIVKSPSATFRVYNKSVEATKKGNTFSAMTQEEADELEEALQRSRIRLEYVFKQRKGYAPTPEILEDSIVDFVDTLEKGFGTKAIRIGGLAQIRKQIDELKDAAGNDVHEMTKASLYMFVVRHLALGTQGLKESMSKTSYYGITRKVREFGLHIDEMSTFEGTVDLNSLFEQLRNHVLYHRIFDEDRASRPIPLALS